MRPRAPHRPLLLRASGLRRAPAFVEPFSDGRPARSCDPPQQPSSPRWPARGRARRGSAARGGSRSAGRGRRPVVDPAERHDAVGLVAAAERARHQVRRVDRPAAADEAALSGHLGCAAPPTPGSQMTRRSGVRRRSRAERRSGGATLERLGAPQRRPSAARRAPGSSTECRSGGGLRCQLALADGGGTLSTSR